MDIGERGWEDAVRIYVAVERDHWRALVNTELNPGVI
jgi:hypothetical protein